MEKMAQDTGGGFRLSGSVDARLKKRQMSFTRGWWRSKASVCGDWEVAGLAKFGSGGFWPTVA